MILNMQLQFFGKTKIPMYLILLCVFSIITPDFLDNYENFYIDDMAWFALLIPCFIFSYYIGFFGGVCGGIIANAYHLFWVFYEKKFHSENIIDESVALHIGISLVTLSCSIGVGILSEKLQQGQRKIQRLNEKLMQMALYDSLTGLPNRNYFMEKIEKSLKKKERISLMFIDLDGFKKVNDNYGHEAGDKLLKEVSQKLLLLQDESTFVSRLGGDEFTVLLNEEDMDRTNEKAKRILSMLKMKFNDLMISGSIGIVLSNDGDTPSSLLKSADTAMYKAKTAGKNTIYFFNQNASLNEMAISTRE